MTRRPLLLSLLLAGCAAAPTGGELAITARPTEINDQGEETTVRVAAVDGKGAVGSGAIRVSSSAGSLKDGVDAKLDSYGTFTVPFTCKHADDANCVDTVELAARWTMADGTIVRATLNLRVLPPPPPPWESFVTWDPMARMAPCSGMGAPQPQPCSMGACAHGFSCVNGACILNGGGGRLQYTLRFSQTVDLDLHVIEPVPNRGVCEVWYGDPNSMNKPSTCGASSSLDLDSNAGCNIDNVNIENVIFPSTGGGKPDPGTYIARVDLWSACMATTAIGWELEVRAGASKRWYCGTFNPMDADRGALDAGVTISTLVVPP
ncbi:MAG: hypothetical protein U0228_35955 [Myxococcaceae bacterium]